MTVQENLELQYFNSIQDKQIEEKYVRLFIDALKACPQVIKADIGASAFVDEISVGARKLWAYTSLGRS